MLYMTLASDGCLIWHFLMPGWEHQVLNLASNVIFDTSWCQTEQHHHPPSVKLASDRCKFCSDATIAASFFSHAV
jgi:hypothetical protein